MIDMDIMKNPFNAARRIEKLGNFYSLWVPQVQRFDLYWTNSCQMNDRDE